MNLYAYTFFYFFPTKVTTSLFIWLTNFFIRYIIMNERKYNCIEYKTHNYLDTRYENR